MTLNNSNNVHPHFGYVQPNGSSNKHFQSVGTYGTNPAYLVPMYQQSYPINPQLNPNQIITNQALLVNGNAGLNSNLMGSNRNSLINNNDVYLNPMSNNPNFNGINHNNSNVSKNNNNSKGSLINPLKKKSI